MSEHGLAVHHRGGGAVHPDQRRVDIGSRGDGQGAFPHVAVLQVLKGAVEQHRSPVDHDDAPTQRLHVVHVVGGEDHRGAQLFVDARDELADAAFRNDIEADSGFVEEDDLG